MYLSRFSRASRPSGFTLVELLVSMAVLSLILVITLQMTSSIASLSSRARSRIETFQEARAAYEAMTRQVSQAMLNTYWDYDYTSDSYDTNGALKLGATPIGYGRQSELQFLSFKADDSTPGGNTPFLPPSTAPTTGSDGFQPSGHAVFFQAPQGYSAPAPLVSPDPNALSKSTPTLPNLLNATGYFLDYGSDFDQRPGFLKAGTDRFKEKNVRWRFHLMEFQQPTEALRIFADGRSKPGAGNPSQNYRWFQLPLSEWISPSNATAATRVPVARLLAENIVSLVIFPHRSLHDKPNSTVPTLSPDYEYDSAAYLQSPIQSPTSQQKLWRNQLPPLVQVTMVAMDEGSAIRLQTGLTAEAKRQVPLQQLGLTDLFQHYQSAGPHGSSLNDDLYELEKKLADLHVNYRVFTSDVSILQAKWSDD